MRIAVDYTLATKHIGGMGVYVRNIVQNLKDIDKKTQYMLHEHVSPLSAKSKFQKLTLVICEQAWYLFGSARSYNKKNANLSFFPNPPTPLFTNIPYILTIADMSFYYDKEMSAFTRWYLYLIYFLAAKRARFITTFSEYSKKDIQKLLRINPGKIKVIPLAASSKFKPNHNKNTFQKISKKLNLNKPYIICSPGTFLKRKNVDDLIMAYNKLPQKIKRNLVVLLVGKPEGTAYENTKKLISKLRLKDFVIFTGYIKPESDELTSLYTNAKIFVYPSLYEGFGLPPLEAMGCGTPVIVYNKTSLPEVVGGAALIVKNPKELTEAIEKVLTDKNLSKSLIQKGFIRKEYFSWKKSAKLFKKTMEDYF